MTTILLLVLAGALSAVLTVIAEMLLLAAYPPTMDVLDSYFLWVGLPAVVLVCLVVGLVCSRLFRRASLVGALGYAMAYALAHFAILSVTFNPLSHRLIFLLLVLLGATWVVWWRQGSAERGGQRNGR